MIWLSNFNMKAFTSFLFYDWVLLAVLLSLLGLANLCIYLNKRAP